MNQIETGYSPALELSKDLISQLSNIQRKLQSAVASSDQEMLTEVNSVKDDFLNTLSSGKNISTIKKEEIDEINNRFNSYYDIAYKTSERMIAKESGEAIIAAIEKMSKEYNSFQQLLENFNKAQKGNMEKAFELARNNYKLSLLILIILAIFFLLIMILFSRFTYKSLINPLNKASLISEELSMGKIGLELEIPTANDEIAKLTISMRKMINYLSESAKVAESIARGNLNVQVQPSSEDDRFNNAFKTMVDNLRNIISEIKSFSINVSQQAEEIAALATQINQGAESQSVSTDETSSTMIEIAAQIENVSKSAQALASNVDETSSSIHEMGSTIQQMAKNSENLLSSVEETATTIEEMIASIKAIANKTKTVDSVSQEAAKIAAEGRQQISSIINTIGARSKEIDKIVKIIESFADQVNFLAINASIEAARAGESGKGFSVVAEEIKRLVERSIASTREISSFIESLQKDVGNAIELSENVLAKITESVSKASTLVNEVYISTQEQSTGASQILKAATNMQNIARELTISANEQAKGAREIMKAVENMNKMTQQVADASLEQKKGGDAIVKAIEQIALVAQQNFNATGELTKATQNLAVEAERLQNLVNQFII
jgi:methyl-accepting chemotaxis protein